MADPFLAEIRMFPFNFAPKGWAWCDGQFMPLSQNTALFSLLGTTYGGDGKSNFQLPDLQARVPLHVGNQPGPGLSVYDLGQASGTETVTLLESEMAAHTHQLRAYTLDNADSKFVSVSASFAPAVGGSPYQTSGNTQLAFDALPPEGGGLPHNNEMPHLTVYFCIALQGVFPPRN
jgi:microcystin-dependent protein